MLNAFSLFAASEAGDAVNRRIKLLGYFSLAAFFFGIGIIFAIISLRDAIALETSLIIANGLVALLMILIGLFVLVIGRALARRHKRRRFANMALAVAPLAARSIASRSTLSSVALIAVIAAGAYLGRKAVKS
jgi:predicted lysophospholipase L1 biosynthesis ABC-type transport system permease subunit